MTDYDFRSLNDKEFEALATDLLAEDEYRHVERFKPGKDAGVDGRWFVAGGGQVVIQCKHWVNSGYAKLLTELKAKGRAKVDRLKPARYLLVTSVPLSAANKQEITESLAPHIRSPADVIGPEDLNTMLGRQPIVVRRHLKLWLTGSGTLAAMLNAAVVGRSQAELDEMRAEAALYVPTVDHARAGNQLAEQRVVILTGAPGIGKTTLARQLVLEYVALGFEPVVLEDDVREAESVFEDGTRQIFYFDDFLGRAYFEALTPAQDSHVLNFMRRVARTPRKRFILTPRTNILNQAAVASDRYADARVGRRTYELAIGALSEVDRARILYNHIWHGRLDPAYVDELYAGKRYREVVRHPNFNPRLVAFVVDGDRVAHVPPADYWPYVLATLTNPHEVWDHLFRRQLSEESRDLVYLAVLNGASIDEGELRAAFFALPPRSTAHPGTTEERFKDAVRQTTGSVLVRSVTAGGAVSFGLFNPSVADYVLRSLSGSKLWADYFPRLRTLRALAQLEQLRKQNFFGRDAFHVVMRAVALAELQRGEQPDAYSLRASRLLTQEPEAAGEFAELVARWFTSPVHTVIAAEPADYMKLFVSWPLVCDRETARVSAEQLCTSPPAWDLPLDEPETIAAFLQELKTVGAFKLRDWVRVEVLQLSAETMQDTVEEDGVLSGFFDPDEVASAERELHAFVTGHLATFGITPTSAELERLAGVVDLDRIRESNYDASDRADEEGDRWREMQQGAARDQAAVDDVFDRSENRPPR